MPAAFFALCVIAVAIAGCGGKKKIGIAELVEAKATIERQEGQAEWKPSAVGDQFFLGDAARTGAGTALLRLANTAMQIEMQAHSVLRFGGQGGGTLSVELGSVLLSGGDVNLDIGAVKVGKDGRIRITANGRGGEFKLEAGTATFVNKTGSQTSLELGQAFVPDISNVVVASVDAGVVVDAAPPDAPPPPVTTDTTIDVKGKHAEVLPAGEKKWQAVPEGPSTFAKGTKIRLGNGTTATAVASGTTIDLVPGSRISLSDDNVLALELGSGKASVPATAEGKITVPGGAVALKGTDKAPAVAKVDVTGRDTRVTVLRDSVKLTGAGNAALAMNRGESATLAPAGTIRVDVSIPDHFDFRATNGESFTIHDPKGPTAVQFDFSAKCPNGGVIDLDSHPGFPAPRVSAGKENANVYVPGGGWFYRIRCTVGDSEGPPIASGRIAEIRDAGRRALPPPNTSVNQIDTLGQTVRVGYQSSVPNFDVRYKGPGSAFTLHMALGGADTTFESTTGKFLVPGTALKEGTYTYWVDHDGVKQDKMSTLIISFDQTAAQVYLESPQNGTAFTGDIDVRGAVLNGWTAKVEGVDVPIDRQRRFRATVGPPPGRALAIRMSHPQHGVHYYLVRGDK